MRNNFLLKSVTVFASSCLVASSLFASDEIKIGVQAPITGELASEGQSIDNGVRLIANQVNENGGINGKKVVIITCDDESQPQKAAVCARKFVNDKVIAVIGSYATAPTEATQRTYYNAKILQTSDATGDALTTKGYWTFLRNSYQNSAQAEFTADYFVNTKKYERIVVVSDYSSYSVGLADATVAALEKIGGNVIAQEKIKANSRNFSATLTKIRALNPDVIYYSGYYPDGGLLRAQQVQLGINADFVGGDSNDNSDFMKLAGSAAAGAYIINFPAPEFLPYDVAKNFLADYKVTYKKDPSSIFALTNVDGLRVILHAIEELKTEDTKAIADYLHKLKDFEGITGPVSFREDGERVDTKFNVYEVQKDNRYKIVN